MILLYFIFVDDFKRALNMFLIDLGQIVINPDCVSVFLGVLSLDLSCDWCRAAILSPDWMLRRLILVWW